jgi:hypothetical protein
VRCEVAARLRANGETPLDQPVIPVAVKAGVDSSERRAKNAGAPIVSQTSPETAGQSEAPAIVKAREFLNRVGRPRLNRSEEEKRSMRKEYMRRYRAKLG